MKSLMIQNVAVTISSQQKIRSKMNENYLELLNIFLVDLHSNLPPQEQFLMNVFQFSIQMYSEEGFFSGFVCLFVLGGFLLVFFF